MQDLILQSDRSDVPARPDDLRQRNEQNSERVADGAGHLLDFKPPERTHRMRTMLAHHILSERRFFAQFVGTEEPPVEELPPPGDKPTGTAYIDKYIGLTKRRMPQLAAGTTSWWLESRPFFGGLQRERTWVMETARRTPWSRRSEGTDRCFVCRNS